jgi:hypothetical protein
VRDGSEGYHSDHEGDPLLPPRRVHLALAVDGNRLTYLDESSPFWPNEQDAEVRDAAVDRRAGRRGRGILAIDDMREPAKYEAFLRPILERLKKIDGRAPVSIMTNTSHRMIRSWRRGCARGFRSKSTRSRIRARVSARRASRKRRATYHECVDLLASIPGNRPVAFRMPCCDSMNSASPRFFAEIFNRTSAQGHWLAIDSSVFMRFSDERFAKYYPPNCARRRRFRSPITRAGSRIIRIRS